MSGVDISEQIRPADRVAASWKKSGIVTLRLDNEEMVAQLRSIVRFFFPRDVAHYRNMDSEEYRNLVVIAQEEINARGVVKQLAGDCKDIICQMLGTNYPLVQTNVYLRAARPSITNATESIGWHRESFYGESMEHSINFWMPIDGVNAESAMWYVPDSHLIPDSEIATENIVDRSVERYSAGHRIGLLYSPKKIVSGIDFSVTKPFCVLPGEATIFSGALIHGSAVNRSERLRFSLDFRLIAQEKLQSNKEHFASGKGYFEPL